MKFLCNKNSLLNEITIAQGIISSRNTMSILSNVLLEAENGKLHIKATDLKIGYETSISVDVEEPGSTTVYCDKFLGVLRTFPEGDIKFNLDNEKLIIDSEDGDSNVQLKVIDASKYPELIEIEDDKYFEIAQKDFIDMINNTIFAVGTDETKYFMTGVYLEREDNCLKMVATDGRRLSYIKKNIVIANTEFKGVIIPIKILTLIKKLASGEGNLKIAFSEKCIFVKFDNNRVYSTLIEGQFPNYKRVIPENQSYTAILNKIDFSVALNRVAIFAEQKAKKILFNFTEDMLTISAEDSEVGNAKAKVACQYKGDDMRMAVNYVHFAEPVKAMEDDDIAIKFSESNRAITLNSVPEGDFFHIIMPMQL